jgi:hypothetical protein
MLIKMGFYLLLCNRILLVIQENIIALGRLQLVIIGDDFTERQNC